MDDDFVQTIASQYLAMISVNELPQHISTHDDTTDEESQRHILRATVKSSTSRHFPPAVSYRKAFLKKILEKLEKEGAEICDEMYEEYASLMSEAELEEECFKTFTLPDCAVTLKESRQLISRGTTGLCTWQASQHLVEWATENKDVFANKCVLELGSGLGFAGIAISKTCQPRKYVFSDCHDFVLQKLAANIVLNFHQCTCEQSSSSSLRKVDDKLCETCINFSNLFKMNFSDVCEKHWKSVGNTSTSNVRQLRTDSRVHLCSLDWEKIDEEEVRALFSDVDVVVAADVVYDPTIISALVGVLRSFLSQTRPTGEQRTAYVASTMRNSQTIDMFVKELGKAGLSWSSVPPPQKQFLFYDRSVPVQLVECKWIQVPLQITS